ncbi:MAG: chemotaxis protein CheA [Lacunisphaera sp.]|nr:chemotaxis protein CheA [Lacunisphaera sp.]
MPIISDQLPAIDDCINRLTAETILAQPGHDDGLVPAFSLLGDLLELCSLEPALREPVAAQRGALEALLDAARPFDDESLGRLRRLVEWLPGALHAAKSGQPAPTLATTAGTPAPAATAAAASVASTTGPADVLLDVHLAENRDLLVEFHAEAVDHLQQIEAALLALDQQPDNPEALNSIFRSFHTFKGNAGFLGLAPMQSLAHEVESLLDLARNHKLRLNAAIVTEILRSRDALAALTQQIAIALEQGRLPDRIIPVSHLITAVKVLAATAGTEPAAGAIPDAAAPVAAALPVAAAAAPVAAPTPAAPDQSRQHANALEAAATVRSAVGNQTVRVNTEKLDSLMDLVGELVIVQSQLAETARTGDTGGGSTLQRNLAQLSRITKDLQHTAMSLRMIPIKSSFQKMERLARDLARDFGKKVSFVTSGEDTELDRTVVEEIADPLVHMVRNALDHGLEPSADRLARGKPETGTLHLKAYHQGSNIVVELQDDGRGIDPDKVLAKARRQNLVAANATPSREEIFNLLFLPGFSTAEKVTAVSGRGVGMDVVRRNIEKLRGKIEVSSEVGRGSTFRIKLPLTMAIIDGLVVRVGTDKFVLPSTSVQRALRPAKEAFTTIQGRGEVLELRGRILPLHRLHRTFSLKADSENPWEGIVVILEHGGKVSALLVDELISKQEVVIKNLGAYLEHLPGVAGGAIMGDGHIALILDPASLLQAA